MRLSEFVNRLSLTELHDQAAWLAQRVKGLQQGQEAERSVFQEAQVDACQDRLKAVNVELRRRDA